jgi:hypothetical protein
MPVGDRQAAFAAHAALDGVHLQTARVPWLNWRGHFGLPEAAESMTGPLERIFEHLGGDPTVLAGRRATSLPGDFFHADSGTLIEFDEFQHFTSHRLATFAFYPESSQLGFDRYEYEDNCREFATRADRYRANKAAIAFGPGGRQRQRAYNDALRDLAAAAMGLPIIRIIAADPAISSADLYAGNRTQLLAKLGVR